MLSKKHMKKLSKKKIKMIEKITDTTMFIIDGEYCFENNECYLPVFKINMETHFINGLVNFKWLKELHEVLGEKNE